AVTAAFPRATRRHLRPLRASGSRSFEVVESLTSGQPRRSGRAPGPLTPGRTVVPRVTRLTRPEPPCTALAPAFPARSRIPRVGPVKSIQARLTPLPPAPSAPAGLSLSAVAAARAGILPVGRHVEHRPRVNDDVAAHDDRCRVRAVDGDRVGGHVQVAGDPQLGTAHL